MWPWKGYSSVALFHYTVPSEATRATWEFASFQDSQDCPKRRVNIWIQQGSFPVINASRSHDFPDFIYFKERTALEWLTVQSAYQPADSAVHPVYNPLPGSWFVAAYLDPYDEPLGFLRKKCRYSLGSIALWSRADNVDLVQPNRQQTFRTRKHFSYYKFYVPDDVDSFELAISNCVVRLRNDRLTINAKACIDYIGIRAKALPFHNPTQYQDSRKNVSSNETVVFQEARPYRASYYYILVVSHGQVTFDLNLQLLGCGETGLYGPGQRNWYLNERGLMWDEGYDIESDDNSSSRHPKEPTTGFQLFATRLKHVEDSNYYLEGSNDSDDNNNSGGANMSQCISTFDFTRVDNVRPFNVVYMLQGRSWYTKWLTVLELGPVFTRFDTLDFTDLGGSLNIRIVIDHVDPFSAEAEVVPHEVHHVIYACLSKGRPPRVLSDSRKMSCDNHAAMLSVSNREHEQGTEALKVVPFPEPTKWYLGFQMRCHNTSSGKETPCHASMSSAMVSVDVSLQPCDHRPLRDSCGGGGKGVCATNHKGAYRFAACACAPGYTGWTCDDVDQASAAAHPRQTLLLTLSNLCFLPAVLVALQRRLVGQSLVYFATMLSSAFYHACDQEALTGHLPQGLEAACLALYVNQEVLQFCDFFCALLSFWVTVVALSRLPICAVNVANLFGSLLVAFLVQYNRTGTLVLAVPVPLGLLMVTASFAWRSIKRKRLVLPDKRGCLLFVPAIICLASAASLATVVGTSNNYAYVHSGWHALIAVSLFFLVLRCKRSRFSSKKEDASEGTGDTAISSSSSSSSASGQDGEVGSVSEAATVMTEIGSTVSLQPLSNAQETITKNTHHQPGSGIFRRQTTSLRQTFSSLVTRDEARSNEEEDCQNKPTMANYTTDVT